MPIDDPKRSSNGPTRQSLGQSGFTLIELIMVIIVLGVLAVFAAPRIFNSGDFYARGFHDETLALLRYAQKTAIAQRRTVCLTFSKSPDKITLSIAAAPELPTCTQPLIGPNKNAAGAGYIEAQSGVAYSSTLTDFGFNGLGQLVVTGGTTPGTLLLTQTIQVGNTSKDINVEAETGYVHD